MNCPDKLRRELIEDGYCVAEGILDDDFLNQLRSDVKPLLLPVEELPDPHFGLITSCQFKNDSFAKLIAWPHTLQLLKDMGFSDNRWMSFFLIDKPPHSWPLWWHQDWMFWDDPISAEARPVQVFLSYYLEDTNSINGSLRVIPRTHLRRHPIHDDLIAHEQIPKTLPLDHPMFQDVPDAVDVHVKAGSVVVADSRLVHAARANQADVHRSLLLGWYLLDFTTLPPPLKEAFSSGYGRRDFDPPAWWADEAGEAVKPIAVDPPTGAMAAASRCRIPGAYLKN